MGEHVGSPGRASAHAVPPLLLNFSRPQAGLRRAGKAQPPLGSSWHVLARDMACLQGTLLRSPPCQGPRARGSGWGRVTPWAGKLRLPWERGFSLEPRLRAPWCPLSLRRTDSEQGRRR